MEKSDSNPYRIFFPLGLAAVSIGILLWVLFINQWITFYPRNAHANIMFLTGLWSFILGFLMTAVPKMTGTFPVKKLEFFLNITLVFVQLILNLGNQTQISVYIFGLQIVFLLFFLIRRILIKKSIPFEGFFFFPFAFLMGFAGIIHFSFNQDYSVFYFLSCEALVLNLILGLGSRLVPVISRSPNALMPNVKSALSNKYQIIGLAFFLNASYLIEVLLHSKLGAALRLVVISIFAIKYFKLFQKPTIFSIVAVGLKIGTAMLVISGVARLFSPQIVASAHLLYIGVFLLITLMVATRVMLAHGQQSTDYEMKSIRMYVVVSLLLITALARYFAQAQIASLFMTVSIYCGLIAVVVWGHKFVKILLQK